MYCDISDVSILDNGDNLSDHLPVVINLSVQRHVNKATVSESSTLNVYRLRWDKCDLSNYYSLTHYYLSADDVQKLLLYVDSVGNADASECISLFIMSWLECSI